MKKRFTVIVLVLSIMILASASAFCLSNQEWVEDLEYLQTKLAKVHKNVYFNLSKKEYNAYFEEFIADSEQLNQKEKVLRLAELFAKIGDSHTTFAFRKYFDTFYPIYFKKFGNDYFVIAATEEYQDLMGAKLVSINGNNIESIREKLARIIVAENQAGIDSQTQYFLNAPALLKYCGVIDENNTYAFKTKSGEEIRSFSRISANEFNKNIKLVQYEKSVVQQHARQLFWYDYMSEDKLLYFQYNSCWSRELEKKHRGNDNPKLPYFNKTTDEIVKILKNKDVDKFVIDVRFNGGGSSAQGTRFAKRLSKMDLDCEVYTIIGNSTFSSAIINAIDFQKRLDATLVGQPTRGKPNHYGEVKSFPLPNSKIRVSYSTKYFKLIKDDMDSLQPDIILHRDYDDFLKGIDTILKRIKEM